MTQQLSLRIGGTQMRFRGCRGLHIQPPAWDYPPFIDHETESGQNVDINIEVSTGEAPGGNGLEVCFDTGDAWRLSSHGLRRRIEMIPRSGDCSPHWCADTDKHYAQVHLYCDHTLLISDALGTRVQHLVQYPLDQILLVQHLLGAGKGLLLHAAGVAINTGENSHGIIFAGVSGAGKSTITRQLMDTPGWDFLSDDRMLLRIEDDRIDMYGTPWPGDAHVARNQCVPLKSLCFLNHCSETSLRTITGAMALDRLLPVTSIPWYDRALLANALDLCEQLLAAVPVYELHFKRHDGQLADLLESLPA